MLGVLSDDSVEEIPVKMFSNFQGLCFFFYYYQYSHNCHNDFLDLLKFSDCVGQNVRDREKEGREDSLGSIVSLPST